MDFPSIFGMRTADHDRQAFMDWLFGSYPHVHKLTKTPLIVIHLHEGPEHITMVAVQDLKKVVGIDSIYNDEDIVVSFWPGQWRTDYFKLTVGDMRAAAATRDPERMALA